MKVGELLLYHVEKKIIGLLQKKFFKEEIETLQEDEWKKSYILGNKKINWSSTLTVSTPS